MTATWTRCAIAGAARDTKLAVDTNSYGDGYIHRATRGLNPARPSWALSFPFTSLDELDEMDRFLIANAAPGFWYTPADSTAQVLVCCDEWAATIEDKSGSGDIVGHLTATFVRSFNPQPGA